MPKEGKDKKVVSLKYWRENSKLAMEQLAKQKPVTLEQAKAQAERLHTQKAEMLHPLKALQIKID